MWWLLPLSLASLPGFKFLCRHLLVLGTLLDVCEVQHNSFFIRLSREADGFCCLQSISTVPGTAKGVPVHGWKDILQTSQASGSARAI